MIQLKEVKKFNRATIADGKLLNHYVFEPLSAIDDDLLAYLNATYNKLLPLYTLVNTYSSDWQNSKISGFSAIQFNSTAEVGASKFAKAAKLTSTDNIICRVFGKSVDITVPYSAYNSYYALAMAGGSYIDNKNSVAMMVGSSATDSSMAVGRQQIASNHSVAFGASRSEAKNYSFSVNYGNGQVSNLPYGDKFYIENSAVGFFYNYITGGTNNIGFYYTSTINSKDCVGLYYADTRRCTNAVTEYTSTSYDSLNTISKYDSHVNASTAVLAATNTRVIASSATIGKNNSSAYKTTATIVYNDAYASAADHSIAVNNSRVTNSTNAIAINDTTISNGSDSFGMNNCFISNSGNFCFNNCEARTQDNILFNNCTASLYYGGDYRGKVFAINNCDATEGYHGLAYDSSKLMGWFNIAINHSTADGAASFAIASSYAEKYFAIAFYESSATDASIALLKSSADKAGIATHESTATISGVAHFNSSATNCSIAITKSVAENTSIASIDSTARNSSIAFVNSSATDSSVALYYSSASDNMFAIDHNRFTIKDDAYINDSFKCQLTDGELNILVK